MHSSLFVFSGGCGREIGEGLLGRDYWGGLYMLYKDTV
jgi:hypothetical protein